MFDTGPPNLHGMLGTLLHNDTAAVQELLSNVAAGVVWQRVLAVPPPLVCSLVGAVRVLELSKSVHFLPTCQLCTHRRRPFDRGAGEGSTFGCAGCW